MAWRETQLHTYSLTLADFPFPILGRLLALGANVNGSAG